MSSKRAAKRSWDIDSGSWDIDTPIGVNFSPGSKRLSVRVIQKYLRNGFLEQRVHHHGNCGRIVCKEKQTGRLRLPPIDCLPRLELIGHPISKEETTVSPITDRRNKLARVVECHAPNAPKLKTDIHVVSSPSSREQADHMKMRLLMDSRYFGNEQASEAIEEIGTLWDVWNEDAALCCQIIDEIPKHICFDKKPPWKVRHNDTWQFIRTLIDMHYAIRVHFFTKIFVKNFVVEFMMPRTQHELRELLKMGEGIPRAETKLYPRLFPHLKYIAVSVCHQHEEIVVQTPTVFESVIQRLSELRAGWERYQSDGYEVGQWKTVSFYNLMLQMNELRLSVLSKPALYRSRQFLFDFSEFRKALIVQIDSHIGALIDSARSYALDAANRVHQLFLTSCAKLHNKSQTEQMTVISEVIDVDLRQMKSTVNALHEALFAVIEYRALNG
ncbi:unnamed protein product [Toxocara canis]|uniref:Dynein heavy chain 7, axonemal n=1 Tax=Toxocara canis TaxID=6265 RepID=A0A183UBY6_TOXCA|nr:unnamed protein product [Toxocara canis]